MIRQELCNLQELSYTVLKLPNSCHDGDYTIHSQSGPDNFLSVFVRTISK